MQKIWKQKTQQYWQYAEDLGAEKSAILAVCRSGCRRLSNTGSMQIWKQKTQQYWQYEEDLKTEDSAIPAVCRRSENRRLSNTGSMQKIWKQKTQQYWQYVDLEAEDSAILAVCGRFGKQNSAILAVCRRTENRRLSNTGSMQKIWKQKTQQHWQYAEDLRREPAPRRQQFYVAPAMPAL